MLHFLSISHVSPHEKLDTQYKHPCEPDEGHQTTDVASNLNRWMPILHIIFHFFQCHVGLLKRNVIIVLLSTTATLRSTILALTTTLVLTTVTALVTTTLVLTTVATLLTTALSTATLTATATSLAYEMEAIDSDVNLLAFANVLVFPDRHAQPTFDTDGITFVEELADVVCCLAVCRTVYEGSLFFLFVLACRRNCEVDDTGVALMLCELRITGQVTL
jgi:hypothetical protein